MPKLHAAWLPAYGGILALTALGCQATPEGAPEPQPGAASATAETGTEVTTGTPPPEPARDTPSSASSPRTSEGPSPGALDVSPELGSSASDAGSGEAPGAGDAGGSEPVRVFLAGDSIVQSYADTPSDDDQAGWGQMLHEYFDAALSIENRSIGGRTARRFIDEGRLDALAAELEVGDYLLVEFGTNDGNRTATYDLAGEAIPYFLDPATDFKAYLERYVDAARERGANPVLVTPTPRNSAYCTGGNGTAAHAGAMQELGLALAVPVVDLNARAVAFLRAICPAPSPETFFLLRPDGSIDGTHFQENGARVLAGFVADGLLELGLLRAHRRTP